MMNLSGEHRENISKAMKGRKLTREHRQNISESMKGKKKSEEHRRRISQGLKPLSEEHRKRLSEALKGRKRSEEIRRKISQSHKGKPSGMKGKHHSEETLRKMSEAQTGEKSHMWKGGHESYYGPNWYHQRELARQRDKGICYDCGDKENGRKHCIHHITPFRIYGIERYQEANDLENLMSLCSKCHGRAEIIGRV